MHSPAVQQHRARRPSRSGTMVLVLAAVVLSSLLAVTHTQAQDDESERPVQLLRPKRLLNGPKFYGARLGDSYDALKLKKNLTAEGDNDKDRAKYRVDFVLRVAQVDFEKIVLSFNKDQLDAIDLSARGSTAQEVALVERLVFALCNPLGGGQTRSRKRKGGDGREVELVTLECNGVINKRHIQVAQNTNKVGESVSTRLRVRIGRSSK